MKKQMVKLIKHGTSCEECKDEDIAEHLTANGAVIPVRCRDCVRYQKISDACGNCYMTTTIMHPDDYCSRGKREEQK